VADSGLADFKLTIGELFPADDLVAQWVFTLTSVAEDLMLLTKELREVEADDLRDYVLFYRLLLTRILEARELVRAWKKYSAIRDFTRGELKWGKLDLVAVYTRPAADQRSVVEQLYVDSRNRTSHYSKIGESELAGLLRDYQRFPARIANYEKNDRLQAEYQWVTAIRFQDSIGSAPWAPGVLQKLERFGQGTAALAQAWIMLSITHLMIYAKQRGIPMERVNDDPDELKRLVERDRTRRGENSKGLGDDGESSGAW
jgi:hypothetical protein